jgi:uncharacterized membrane protein YbhN (UPF0104 family)/tRNA A-37 threonylcarbamoyl transferase component Bud32
VGRDRRSGARGFRFFASPVDEPRARRASDVLLVATAFAGLVVLGLVTQPPAAVEQALIDLLAALPGFLDGVWQLLYDVLALWALVLILVALARRRSSLARDQLLAALVAVVVGAVAGWIVDASWPGVRSGLWASQPPPSFPSLRVALAGACVATAAPYLSRPVRHVSLWIVALGAAAAAVVGVVTPTGAIAGLLVAAFAAAAVHLVFGSCGGRPGLGDVRAALADLGVSMGSLGAADRQPAGAFLVQGVATDGRRLDVKVYGRDAYDAQLITKVWRTVWYREERPAPSLSRLQQAEHEAFLTLLAQKGGVPTQDVVSAGVTAEDDAILVLELRGEPLADLPDEKVTDTVLGDVWDAVDRLHESAIAHGQIDPFHVWVDDGQVTLADLSGATIAPSDHQRRVDHAQALVTSVVIAGTERGLAAAHAALEAEGLAEVVPYLQMPALSRGLRPQARRAGVDLDELRQRAAELAGVRPADLQQLRRVTWSTLLQTGLLALALSALVSGLAGLDLEEIATQLREANWWWVAFAALLVQTPRLAQSLSTLGASPRPLPLGPVYTLQLAISYINLAVPSSAARLAVNVRFFQRQGVPSGSAVAVGAVDSVAGFVVQVSLLASILLFSNVSLDLQLEPDTSGRSGGLLAALVLVAIVAGGAVLVVGPWRRAVVAKAAGPLRDAWGVVRGLRSARRWAMLLGGNLAAEILFASSLGGFARAFGYDVGLGELLLINVSTALLAGFMPVPGGIGITEGALTVGLTAAGLPESTAFAAAILYRLACFYLPPIWGWFAFRWLQTNKYL